MRDTRPASRIPTGIKKDDVRKCDGPAVLLPTASSRLAGGTKRKEHAMSETHNSVIAVIGIDIGKNSFHVVGLDGRGAIALRRLRRNSRALPD